MRETWRDPEVGGDLSAPCSSFAALGVLDREAAFDISKWTGLGLISAYGFAAARLTGATVLGSLRRAAIAGLIAAFLIIIKALLH